MMSNSSMIRFLAVAAFITLCLGVPTKEAQAACTSPAGVAGEIIYNSSNNILQYCDDANWIGLGGNGQGYTMVSGWPDAIRCVRTSDSAVMIWHANFLPVGTTYRYRSIVNTAADYTMDFNSSGAWTATTTPSNCDNKTIAQLYASGQAYNYVGGGAGGGGSSQWTTTGSDIYYNTGKVGVGTVNLSPTLSNSVSPQLIVNGTGATGLQVGRNTTPGAGGAILSLTSTRGADINSYTAVQSGDGLGSVMYMGSDGVRYIPAAHVQGQVDGAVTTDTVPGRLIFGTATSGSNNVTERMRIDSTGGVSIGSGASANATSLLELSSTTKGFLPPRMTTAERDAIASPAVGLTIFNTTTRTLDTYGSVQGSAANVWKSNGGALMGSGRGTSGDYNTIVSNAWPDSPGGVWWMDGPGSVNGPTGTNSGVLVHMDPLWNVSASKNKYSIQLGTIGSANSPLYYRSQINGTWSAWGLLGGGTPSGPSMVSGWPDAIKCSDAYSGATRILYLSGVNHTGNNIYIDPIYSGADVFVSYNATTGAYVTKGAAVGTTGNCYNVNISAVVTAGNGFNFVGGGGGSGSVTSPLQLSATAGGVLTFTDPGLAHGVTSGYATDTFLQLEEVTDDDGGARIIGFSDTAGLNPLRLIGTFGDMDPTDNVPAVWLVGGKRNGTATAALSATETVFAVSNNGAANSLVVLGNGNIGIGTTTVPSPAKMNVYGGYIQAGNVSGASNDVALNLMTLGGDQYMIGNASSKGWTLTARTDGWTGTQANDMGLYYWNGSTWKTTLSIDSITGNVGIGSIIGDPTATGPKLQVSGAIVSVVNNAAAATTIDFATSNVAYTSAACGAFTLQNMADGGSYTLIVKGSGTGPATFTHTGMTVKTTGTLTCTAAKHTVFSFIRAGTDVYVTMITGY